MRVADIIQNITKAQAALNDLNIGEAKSRLDKAIEEISHPALRFLIVDEAAWLTAFREEFEKNRKAAQKEANDRIEQLKAELKQTIKE